MDTNHGSLQPTESTEKGRPKPALLLELYQHSNKGQACEKAVGQAPGFVRLVSPTAAPQPPSFPTLPGGSTSWEGAVEVEQGDRKEHHRCFLACSSLLDGMCIRASAHSQLLPYMSGGTGRW